MVMRSKYIAKELCPTHQKKSSPFHWMQRYACLHRRIVWCRLDPYDCCRHLAVAPAIIQADGTTDIRLILSTTLFCNCVDVISDTVQALCLRVFIMSLR
ncbi:MAG: hypothetical protein J5543_08160 [Bacteroidales bacterium]|nr:hypothetical protein [Bacteroidales bacterium]